MRFDIGRAIMPAALALACAACGAGDAGPPAEETQAAAPSSGAAEASAASADEATLSTTADEGNESGTFIPRTDTWDSVRDGAHVVLRYDEGLDAFSGMLTNNTDGTLCDAQVSVQLENGPDLGPSAPVDLDSGAAHPIEIRADGQPVDWWSATSSVQDCG